jgi:hypothetical protein
MKSATTSLKIFGIYMILIPGIGLITVPDILLDLFGLSYGEELWMPRMIGLLAFIIGVYYYYITKNELHQLYTITVVLRYFAALFMVGLWLKGEVEIMILLFAAIDVVGASWTMLAMKNAVSNPVDG